MVATAYAHPRMTHTEWLDRVAFVCRTILDEKLWVYEKAARAVERLYGPCPPPRIRDPR